MLGRIQCRLSFENRTVRSRDLRGAETVPLASNRYSQEPALITTQVSSKPNSRTVESREGIQFSGALRGSRKIIHANGASALVRQEHFRERARYRIGADKYSRSPGKWPPRAPRDGNQLAHVS